jgi:hypothetical protein
VEAPALVARRDDVAAVRSPRGDDPVDCKRIEIWAVGEHDDGRLGLVRERCETAAERRARAALPLGAGTLSTSSSCAPLTTIVPSTVVARSAASTSGRKTVCFGGESPYRVDAPAARTTA